MKRSLGLFAALSVFIGAALAQSYPDRPIRIVVPWPAGGNTDAVTRILAQRLSQTLSNPVVVENRAGANGQIGAQTVARAAPDGYTLLVASAETHSISVALNKKLPYDPLADFAPLVPFAKNPFVLVGRADLPAQSTRQLVQILKANPGKMSYGSWGIGSTGQIAMEMFKGQAGIDVLHVPFQGSAPAETALLGGQIDLMVLPVGRAAALRPGGKIRVFSTLTTTRSMLLEDVPSIKDEGYEREDAANWFGLMAPARTPEPVLQKLVENLGIVVASKATQAELRSRGVEVFSLSQEQFKRFVAAEQSRWGDVVQRANIHLDAK